MSSNKYLPNLSQINTHQNLYKSYKVHSRWILNSDGRYKWWNNFVDKILIRIINY